MCHASVLGSINRTGVDDEFQQRWQYPHCIGAIDGKHIAIQVPANTGSQYHNYKQFFSIILMAVVDARYRFVMVDVGANGRACDASVFAASAMSAALENNELSIPPSSPLPGRVNDVSRGIMPVLTHTPHPTRHVGLPGYRNAYVKSARTIAWPVFKA